MTHVLNLSDITPKFHTDELFVIIGDNSKCDFSAAYTFSSTTNVLY